MKRRSKEKIEADREDAQRRFLNAPHGKKRERWSKLHQLATEQLRRELRQARGRKRRA